MTYLEQHTVAKGPFEIVSETDARGIIELYETADSSQREIRVQIGTRDTLGPNAGLREKLEHVRDLLDAEIKAMRSSQP